MSEKVKDTFFKLALIGFLGLGFVVISWNIFRLSNPRSPAATKVVHQSEDVETP